MYARKILEAVETLEETLEENLQYFDSPNITPLRNVHNAARIPVPSLSANEKVIYKQL